MEIFYKYLSEIIASIALLFSLYSASRTHVLARKNAELEQMEKSAIRRRDIIVSEERKLSVIKKLLLVLVQKQQLLSANPQLERAFPNEKDRIVQCLDALKRQSENQDEIEEILANQKVGACTVHANDALAFAERLIIRMETELSAEQSSLETMKELMGNA